MKWILNKIAAVFSAVYSWVKKPTMNKLALTLIVVFAFLFLDSFYSTEGQLSYIPSSFLLSSGMVSMLYLVDRVGFSKINTIQVMQNDKSLYYKVLLPLYAVLIALGPIVALFIARF